MKLNTALIKSVLKAAAPYGERIRVWLTKKAWKSEVERNMKKASVIILLPFIVGCSAMRSGLIGYDNTIHNGALNPYLNQVPEGYEANPYVQNAAGTRVDITGWEVRWEIIPSARFLPTLLPDAIAKRSKASRYGPVLDFIEKNKPAPQESGADDAAKQLADEAEKAGVQ